MNGSVCRLRDIHELFMDTGLGSKAYSIIEQGKIGLILSSKPADRRALIEEAAGITKYKARRRQTQLKLEAAQQNLLRVNDIVHEVEKQLESLKRQAGKARRYRALREEMQAVERVALRPPLPRADRSRHARWPSASPRSPSASRRPPSRSRPKRRRWRCAAHVLYDDEARLEEVRGRLGELTLAVDRHQGRSGYCKEQIAETDARARQARARGGGAEGARGAAAEESLEARRADEARLRAELERRRDGEPRGRGRGARRAAAAPDARPRPSRSTARDAQVGASWAGSPRCRTRGSPSPATPSGPSADLLKLGGGARRARARARPRSRACATPPWSAGRGGRGAARRAGRASATRRVGRARRPGRRPTALARDAEALQSERDSLAGRLASLEEIVATHAAFDEGVRAPARAPEGLEAARRGGRPRGDRLRARARGRGVPGRPAAGRAGPGRHATPCAASATSRSRARAAAPSCRWPRRARKADCGTAARGRARGAAGARPALSDLYRVTGPHADAIRAALPDALVFDTLEDALRRHRAPGPGALRHARRRDRARVDRRGRPRR